MTQRQVLTVSPDGSISGLQRKHGEGIDLRQFGKVEVRRASLIEWNDDEQLYFVLITRGLYSTIAVTVEMIGLAELSGDTILWDADATITQNVAYFQEYDDAVQAEILVLDYIRKTEGAGVLD